MKCRKPYKKGIEEYGCGQCTFCRINRARQWMCRMQLEAREHEATAFVTLTYNEEHVPPMLEKRAVQLFIKRIRQELKPRELRYYAVGEYGEKSWRPHFHLVMFGLHGTEQTVVEKCWPYGFVKVGPCEDGAMSYVMGYVVKKMTNPKDQRLGGRTPEFAVMSQGIGRGFVGRVVSNYERNPKAIEKGGMFSGIVQMDGKAWSVGPYLKKKVNSALAFTEEEKAEVRACTIEDLYAEKASVSLEERERIRKSKCSQAGGRIKRFIERRRSI